MRILLSLLTPLFAFTPIIALAHTADEQNTAYGMHHGGEGFMNTGMMGAGSFGMGGGLMGWFGLITTILFWIVLILVIVALWTWIQKHNNKK